MDREAINNKFFDLDDVVDDGVFFVANDNGWIDDLDIRKYAKVIEERHLENADKATLDIIVKECLRS